MANDMLSLPKELESGDTHNAVWIYRERLHASSYGDAANRVFKDFLVPCVDDIARSEEELELELRASEPSEVAAVRGAIQCLKDWAGGHISWEKVSGRHEHRVVRFDSMPVGAAAAQEDLEKIA